MGPFRNKPLSNKKKESETSNIIMNIDLSKSLFPNIQKPEEC